MDKIVVGFSKPKKWKPFAWLIMVGYNIPYDHVYVKFHSNSYDRDVIYQASHSMLNFMSPVIFNEENLIIDEFEIEILPENKISLMKFAIDNAGRSYGIKQAIGMGIVRIAEILGKSIKNPFASGTQTFVCSELTSYILEQYSDIKINRDQDDVTPKDVYERLMLLKTRI